MKVIGKVSHFGGPDDTGVSSSEDLAFWEDYEDVDRPEELFLPAQPPGTTGLARRLDPQKHYIACRWDYDVYSKSSLASGDDLALIKAQKTGRYAYARPSDWGPHADTNRVADISPGLMNYLGITTDDIIEVTYPSSGEVPIMPTSPMRVAISAGHAKYVEGANGYISENDETFALTELVVQELKRAGADVVAFFDERSKTVNDNLNAIVNWHNAQERDLDVSIHFNSSSGLTPKPIGTECLYVTQDALAEKIAAAVAEVGLINRGAKYTSDLKFLNQTSEPSVLIEALFVNSEADTDIYTAKKVEIARKIATAIVGVQQVPEPVMPVVTVALTAPAGVTIRVIVNGEDIFLE